LSTADDEVRDQLLAHGDDGKMTRHTLFFFFEGDLSGLEQAALACDFVPRRMVEREGLILEKTLAVDKVSFGPVGTMMEQWAEKFGADYDGWECAVATGA
jgi:hypothetical protein